LTEYDLEGGKRRLLDEYGDADNYDIGEDDVGLDFYTALAQETGGPVLELGCGTGRVAIPMAQSGLEVTGLDAVPGMLAQARRKSEAAGVPVRWVEADARAFDLGERFRLIFLTGNTFQAFLTNADQEALLRCARAHLLEDGLLAFETRNPRWRGMADGPDPRLPQRSEGQGAFAFLETRAEEADERTYTDVNGREIRATLTQSYDHISQVLQWTGYQRWYEGGELMTKTGGVAVRFTFPQELDALLHYNGFDVVRRYGDWDLSPLSATSHSIIVVCRKRRPAGAATTAG
jgi:SAM-dependent methyltransferase